MNYENMSLMDIFLDSILSELGYVMIANLDTPEMDDFMLYDSNLTTLYM